MAMFDVIGESSMKLGARILEEALEEKVNSIVAK